jgi:endoglucanase
MRRRALPAGQDSGTGRRAAAIALAALAISAAPAAAGGDGQEARAAGQGANPFAGRRLFVDPRSSARRQVERWSTTRPAAAAAIRRIARRPQADWFGDWNHDVRAAVANRVGTITAAGALPVLVAYNIPHRDCGGYSAGGARSGRVYRHWIRRFAAGIGRERAVIVLEPDALAGLDCLPARRQRERLVLLAAAVRTLGARAGVATYIDAGHSSWQAASVIASRLAAAGVARVRGFSLNVANFQTTRRELAYGRALSAQIGDKPFVVDTGRNGAGPPRGGQWCNPPGRALGRPPTAHTGRPLVDAYLWIKPPGESDGTCNGGPPAGTWWPSYALGLASGSPA